MIELIANSFLVYVITRIVVLEDISEKFRVFWLHRVPLFHDLLSCFFCFSVWVAFAIAWDPLEDAELKLNILQKMSFYIVIANILEWARIKV